MVQAELCSPGRRLRLRVSAFAKDSSDEEAEMSKEHVRALTRVIPVTAFALCVAAAAMAQDVTFNAMPGTDFTKFKTYKWVGIEGTQHPDQIVEQEIKTAIDAQLATKGLKKVDADPADLYVGYQVAVNQERQWNAYGGGVGFRVGGGMASATSSTLNIGTLGVDIYDSGGKTLVWRGSATKTIDDKASPQKRQDNITKAMTKLLKNYPPPVKK
jgi:Domain of unknown function (DUF4136)